MEPNKLRKLVFHPITVLFFSLGAAVIFALLSINLFGNEHHWLLLYYFTPVGIPFVAFLFDRAENIKSASVFSWVTDLLVLGPALTRAVFPVPFISGHALFLTYAVLSTRSMIARTTALLVLLQVAYLKITWNDTTLIGGAIFGTFAALLYGLTVRR
ncbi:MAG: hypothetical protein AAF639_12030 [Chloroflexota bacterium]